MNPINKSFKSMTNEVLEHCKMLGCLPGNFDSIDIKTFKVNDVSLWNHDENRNQVQRKLEFFGIRFLYEDGYIRFIPMSNEEYLTKNTLKDAAYKRYFLQTRVTIQNSKIDKLLAELQGYKEIQVNLPFETKSSDVVIFMSPKDTPEKDFAGFELCDVLVYDRNYEEYFILKNMDSGFTEIFTNEVPCRTGLSDGGYMVRIRELAIIKNNGCKLYIMPEDTPIKKEFSDEELEQALMDCYSKSFKTAI